ncbi:DMT family transporter [Candidatus Palauibacter sp.]|uniref:DMT family transporter n=1 Tax=Candidatus Palauibacter sp. TaxID=3101350 RepID=UPI003B51CF11
MRNVTRGLLVVFLACLGYGALPIFAKLALAEGVDVLPLLAWRFLLGSGLLWIFVAVTGRPRPPRARLLSLGLLGLIYASNATFYMLGLDRLPASVATLVLFSYPAMTVLLARLWIGEQLTRRRIAALALTTAGCALTVGTGLGGGDPLGVGLIVLAVVFLAAWIVRSHGVFADLPPISATATVLSSTAVAISVAGLATGGIGVPLAPAPLLLLGAIGLFSTAIPITAFLIGIQWIGPGRAATAATMEPAVTLALAAAVLGDRLSAGQWMGAALILAGVIALRLEPRSAIVEGHP